MRITQRDFSWACVGMFFVGAIVLIGIGQYVAGASVGLALVVTGWHALTGTPKVNGAAVWMVPPSPGTEKSPGDIAIIETAEGDEEWVPLFGAHQPEEEVTT